MNSDRALISPAGQDFLLNPDIIFLNHGSFGARPRQVIAAYQHWQLELEKEPVKFLGRDIDQLLRAARLPLAEYLGTHADNIVFVPNATHGMNIVARSLPLGPGDAVLGTSHEYGAVERTWRFLASQRGFSYHTQHVPVPIENAQVFVDQLWEGVTEHTRAIVVSHITSPTALILPVALICHRARKQGIAVIVDGAHAPGQIPLDLDELGADYYVGNLHKWLAGPVGAGFLYARPELQQTLLPLVVSWGYESRTPSDSTFQDYFGWIGTDDPAAYLSVPAAIAYQRERDWDTVRSVCHRHVIEACKRICELTGMVPLSPLSPEWVGQMCAIPIPKRSDMTGEALQKRLFEENRIEIPINDWQDVRLIRISLQAYNSPTDVEVLITALQTHLRL